MFAPEFYPESFLRSLYGTEPFIQYCRSRDIPYEQTAGAIMRPWDAVRWVAALAQMPRDRQFKVETEICTIAEMAEPEAVAQLLSSAHGTERPPDDIPSGAPLSLWFFLHAPDIFHEVFFNLEIQDVDSWQNGQAQPGLSLDELEAKTPALTDSACEFYRVHEGVGRFCNARSFRLPGAYVFVAQVGDRPQLFEGISGDGQYTVQHLRPVVPVVFVYYIQDGTVLLHSRMRSHELGGDLLRRFWEVMFGTAVNGTTLGHSFRLDLFKKRFAPLADADDIEAVRVKALHLVYPARSGRGQVRLETLASDEPFALLQLLQDHGGGEQTLGQLEVLFAELQIRMRVGGRTKNYYVRLWGNRCSLDGTLLAVRFRTCLKRWGNYHA